MRGLLFVAFVTEVFHYFSCGAEDMEIQDIGPFH